MLKKLITNIDFNKATIIFLIIVIVLILLYSGFVSQKLFSAIFIEDDWGFIERAGMISENPLSFFTLTVSGFYRPIGYNLPSLIFLIVGFNPLYFHLLNLCIHLLTGLTLYLFARRFFDNLTGVLASLLFISFPTLVIAVGFTASTFQDELSTLFFILTLLFTFRNEREQLRKKPYWAPAIVLLLGAFCKDTWIGLLPAIIIMDWVNYRYSLFRERLARLWVFVIPFISIILKFVFMDINMFQTNMGTYAGWNFSFNNMLYGLTLPFMPFEIFDDASSYNLLRLFAPVLFIALSVTLARNFRIIVLLLITAFIGIFASQLIAPMSNYIFGWAHIFPLLVFSSLLIAVTLRSLGRMLKNAAIFWFPALLSIVVLIGASYPTTEMLTRVIQDISTEQSVKIRGLRAIIRKLPDDSLIYSFGGPNYYVARQVFLKPSMQFSGIAFGKRINKETKGLIMGNADFIKSHLKPISRLPNFKLICYINKKWYDKTKEFREWLNQDVPFPVSVFLDVK